jgi:membrane associated rhomboid family serine protease
MFIPLKDVNPSRTAPVVNVSLILINIGAFFYELTLSPHSLRLFELSYAMVPARVPMLLAGREDLTTTFLPLLTSMFLHSGFLHLAGNMLFLWIFGDNVEDHFGHVGYLGFYLICGIGAGLLHTLFNWTSSLPALGASGAISGVMGAYLLLFPKERILTLVFIFLIPIPAIFVLGYWFLLQFLGGMHALGSVSTGGVAWWAHVGGFVLGMFFAGLSRRRRR